MEKTVSRGRLQKLSRQNYQAAQGTLMYAIQELKEAVEVLKRPRKTIEQDAWIREKIRNAGEACRSAGVLTGIAEELRHILK